MTTLTNVGKDMKGKLANVEKGYVSRALFGGLVVVLERRGTQWRLAIGRTRSAPSITEVEVIERDFGLPVGVQWSWASRPNRKKKITYQVAETTWIEVEKERGG